MRRAQPRGRGVVRLPRVRLRRRASRAGEDLVETVEERVVEAKLDGGEGVVELFGPWPSCQGRVAARLIGAATRRARRLAAAERAAWSHREAGARPPVPETAPAHPDLVLARAVRDGVVSPCDAELVVASRLERVRLSALARRWGVRHDTLRKRRLRAERRLVAWLADQEAVSRFRPPSAVGRS